MELKKFSWGEEERGKLSTQEISEQESVGIDADKLYSDFMDSVGQYTNDQLIMSTAGERQKNARQTADLALQLLAHQEIYREYAKNVKSRIEELCVQIGRSGLPRQEAMELAQKLRKYQE